MTDRRLAADAHPPSGGRDTQIPWSGTADEVVRALFADPEQAAARLDLLARWRAAGLGGDTSIVAAVLDGSRRHPAVRLTIASADGTVTISAAEAHERAMHVAAGLSDRGVAAGDRVAVQLPNSTEALVAYLAINAIGAVLVPIVQIYGPADTTRILDAAGASVLVTARRAGRADVLDWLADRTDLAVVFVGDAPPPGATLWSDMEATPAPLAAPLGTGDTPAALLFTSGTTGEPKGVVHTSSTLLACLQTMPCPSFGFEGTFLWPWPSGHIGGILAALSPFVRGIDTVLLGERWDEDFLVSLLVDHGIRGMSGVTTVALRLLDAIEAGDVELELQEFFSGGAAIPPALVDRANARGWHFTRSFGMTENPVLTATSPTDPPSARRASEGAPVREARIRIVADDGRVCERGQDGEVVIVAAQQMLGYTSVRLNAESFTSDGWLKTGDIGRCDLDGHLTITGRKKDLIIRGGENLAAQEIEQVLSTMPGVVEAAVVGAPDPVMGERAAAFVIFRGADPIDLVSVRAHFESQGVARQKVPERLEIVDELPRTPTGKVHKDPLRARLRDEAVQAGQKENAT